MSGNTAPYMLYAYARIQGIKKKVNEVQQSSGGMVLCLIDCWIVSYAVFVFEWSTSGIYLKIGDCNFY